MQVGMTLPVMEPGANLHPSSDVTQVARVADLLERT